MYEKLKEYAKAHPYRVLAGLGALLLIGLLLYGGVDLPSALPE